MLNLMMTMALMAGVAGAAEMDHMAMGHMGKDAAPSASSKAYMDANMTMHKGMDVTFSGDADKDFVAGMIPHHQGAVDMAKVELHYGKDPEIRKFAQDVIDAQSKEIEMMKAWQGKHR